MSTLKPWYQVVVPREDLRDNRPLDASEFAVHLDHIREQRAHPLPPISFSRPHETLAGGCHFAGTSSGGAVPG